jgi:gluconokinase
MGVSGCGKTTVAELLAKKLDGAVYLEGDSFHPPENKARMGSGVPLTDDDRWPWFEVLNRVARETVAEGKTPILACSALKAAYRDALFRDIDDYRIVLLEGSFELIERRMNAREHEYMTSTLLQSQFDTLERPEPGPNVLVLSIEETPDRLIEQVTAWLAA